MSSVPITSTTLVLPLSSFTSAFITFSGANSAMRSGCWKASNTLSSGASNLDTNFACQVSPVFSRLSETISFAGPVAACWMARYFTKTQDDGEQNDPHDGEDC